MLRCLFHSLASLRGKKPPCCDVLFVSWVEGLLCRVFQLFMRFCLYCSPMMCKHFAIDRVLSVGGLLVVW